MNETWAMITAITVLLLAGDALEGTEAITRYLTTYWHNLNANPNFPPLTVSVRTEPDWPIEKQKPD